MVKTICMKSATDEPQASETRPEERASEPVELAPVEAAGVDAARMGFSAGTRRVLEALKAAGEASAEELAKTVGVTVSAIRQHLRPLEEEGLVAHHDLRPGPGRPRRRYCLAPAAEALWPKRYGLLANQLLGVIGERDPKLIDDAFDRRAQERIDRAGKRLRGLRLEAQVEELARILDEDGYLAECIEVDADHWLVIEHNCAIVDVASKYRRACSSELAFVRAALPEATVERVKHMMAGAHVCAYDIRRQAA